jgi:hypothetical protein
MNSGETNTSTSQATSSIEIFYSYSYYDMNDQRPLNSSIEAGKIR